MWANPARQVRLIDFLRRVATPSVLLRQFALLEVIAELSNGHGPRVRWSVTLVQLQDQSCNRQARIAFISVLLDSADNLLVVQTLAPRVSLRPTKLPDRRAPLTTDSFQTSALHFCPPVRRCRQEHFQIPVKRVGEQASELPCGGNDSDVR